MPMGHSANFAVTIEKEKVEELVPNQWKAFISKVKEFDTSLEDFAQTLQNHNMIEGLEDEQVEELDKLWETLTEAFAKKTKMTLYINYHDKEEDGDKYDEVKGVFFSVDFGDVYGMTDEAKYLFRDGIQFEIKQYVTYG